MKKFTNPLDNIRVASPCKADWNSMIGNERQRFCSDCKLNVYNLSGMSKREAENLITQSEGRLCVRFYRRADGSVLTKDCPVGWQAIKRRVSRTTAAFASLIFGLMSGLGLTAFFNQSYKLENVTGQIEVTSDGINETIPTMGDMEIQTAPKLEGDFTLGRIVTEKPERESKHK